jgi:hypothetical protein
MRIVTELHVKMLADISSICIILAHLPLRPTRLWTSDIKRISVSVKPLNLLRILGSWFLPTRARLRHKLCFMSRLTVNTRTWYVLVRVVDLTSLTTTLIMVNDIIYNTWRHYGSTNHVWSLLGLSNWRQYQQTTGNLSSWQQRTIPCSSERC